MHEIEEAGDSLMCAFEDFKRLVQEHDNYLYEQWKAGGFIVSDNIVSMYPNVSDIVEKYVGYEENEESDEE